MENQNLGLEHEKRNAFKKTLKIICKELSY